jgi:DNA-binding LacI/PurR family transcriptional regulator
MAKRISLTEVARRTGVSLATVSLALRGAGRMAPKTRERIRKAAAEMGYVPNPLLAALASKHFGAEGRPGVPLAYIHSPEPLEWSEITAQVLFKHLREHAQRLGYFLEQFKVGDFQDGRHATQVLFSRGVQGLIVSAEFKPEMLPGMDWTRFFVVGLGERLVEKPNVRREPFYRTAVDHFGSVVSAWNETWSRGYRKIGFVLYELDPNWMDDQLRWAAAQICLQRVSHRTRIPPFLLSNVAGRWPINVRNLRDWVDHHRPDAIIGFNAYVHTLLDYVGFRVPRDVGFASLHKGTGIELMKKDTDAGMREMRLESHLASVELLDQQIRRHQYVSDNRPRTVMIHSEWIDGESLPEKIPNAVS